MFTGDEFLMQLNTLLFLSETLKCKDAFMDKGLPFSATLQAEFQLLFSSFTLFATLA